MIRIINLRVAVMVKSDIKSIVEKKYPPLRGAIETIHVVRRAVDARKKPNIVFVYTLFIEVHNEAQVMKSLVKKRIYLYLLQKIQNLLFLGPYH